MGEILLLGATGRTGSRVLHHALSEGHIVHALVRDKAKITLHDPSLHLFEGHPANYDHLKAAIEGCNAVISTLNISRTSDWPWAGLRTPRDLLSKTIEHILTISKVQSLQRVIITSAWGVGDSRPEMPWWFRWVVDHSNIGIAYADHQRQENLLRSSKINWTAVRPVGLVNSKWNKPVKVSIDGHPKPSLLISRDAVAKFLLNELHNYTYSAKFPVIYQ